MLKEQSATPMLLSPEPWEPLPEGEEIIKKITTNSDLSLHSRACCVC